MSQYFSTMNDNLKMLFTEKYMVKPFWEKKLNSKKKANEILSLRRYIFDTKEMQKKAMQKKNRISWLVFEKDIQGATKKLEEIQNGR